MAKGKAESYRVKSVKRVISRGMQFGILDIIAASEAMEISELIINLLEDPRCAKRVRTCIAQRECKLLHLDIRLLSDLFIHFPEQFH